MIEILSQLPVILHGVPNWVHAVTGVVTAASAVAALTPTPKDDDLLASAYTLLDALALNFGFAKDR